MMLTSLMMGSTAMLWHELPFGQIWAADTEFYPGRGLAHGGREGDPITPLCLAAKELRSGCAVRLWQDELGRFPPYPLDAGSVFIAFNNTAEFTFHIAKEWGQPARSLDMYVEYRHLQNDGAVESDDRPKGFYSQIGALGFFGEGAMAISHKEDMRDRIIQGPPFTDEERARIIRYCEDDVDGLIALIKHIIPTITLPGVPDATALNAALHRSNSMWAFAQHQSRGVPIHMRNFNDVVGCWDDMRCDLVTEMDKFGIYRIIEGRPVWGKEGHRRFVSVCKQLGVPWPLLDDGDPDLKAATRRDMCVTYPAFNDLSELISSMGKLRLQKLHVGNDGRNRTSLWPFKTKTSRCAPGANSFVFGPAKWFRFFISPPPGLALIHRDYSQEEPIIAAILSGDPELLAACEMSCGVYLGMAIQLGMAPPDATKETHEETYALFKIVMLSVLYGSKAKLLASRTRLSLYEARELLAMVKFRYRVFFDYAERILDHAGLYGEIRSTGYWRMICPVDINPNCVRNFPVQSCGAEILRTAVILAERRGIQIVAPVHDALMAQCPVADAEDVSAALDRTMRDATAIVLRGYEIKSDEQIIRPGGRFFDKRGAKMWDRVSQLAAKYRRNAG
jgi:DNA polymerase family A